MVSYSCSLKSSLYLAWFCRYCVKHLAKNILTENALIPIFVFRDKTFSTLSIQQPHDTSLDVLTVTIGPRASSLQCSDVPVEMHFGDEKLKQNRGRGHWILTPNESVLTFLPPKAVQYFIKIK